MKLEPEQQAVLDGAEGEAAALALRTMVAYGEAFNARRLVAIKSAHLAGSFGMLPFSAYYDIVERLAKQGLRVKVPTTVNPGPGRSFTRLNRLIFGKQNRLEKSYAAVGVTPNYSCVCYFGADCPRRGDVLGWAESSAVVYANSVLGARTNRNSILIDLCGAVTGLVPEFGFLLDENRRGRVLVKLRTTRMDVGALGFLIGRKVTDRVPVLEHYPFTPVELKNLGAAMAASGGVGMFHVVGLTPEAPDLKTAFQGAEPAETITITQEDLDGLRSPKPASAGLIVFGCPQMTCEEATPLAERLSGRRLKRKVLFCMAPAEKRRFESTTAGDKCRAAGVTVCEHCPLAALSIRPGTGDVLTNSGKLYYYLAHTLYGTTEDCLRAAGAE